VVGLLATGWGYRSGLQIRPWPQPLGLAAQAYDFDDDDRPRGCLGERHDAAPQGWHVGQPSYDERRSVWEQHAFDPTGQAKAGVRSREWTAVAPTELEVIRELARCLRVIREGRVPT
jgi:hypothetical protein